MTAITPELLRSIRLETPPSVLALAAPALQSALRAYNVQSTEQVAMLLANLAHESGFRPIEENLSYTAARIVAVWPSRFASVAAALPYAGNPQALANRVYADRVGNGNEASGDGWRYRGRGFIQTTFRGNYRTYSPRGYDLEARPELLTQYGISALNALEYWTRRGCGRLADAGDLRRVRIAINGGLIGYSAVQLYYARAKSALST